MNNKIIISLISLAAVFGIVFFLVIPLWSSVNGLKAALGELEIERAEIEKFLTKNEQVERNYLRLQGEAQKVFLALPEGGDISYLLIQFENIVRENGLLLDGTQFSKTEEKTDQQSRRKAIQLLSEKTDIKKLPVGVLSLLADVGMSGSYEAFKNCLKSLENNIRPMDIESINLKPQIKNKGGIFDNLGIFQFDIKINTYYQ